MSGSSSRRKGARAEQAVARWLRANGWAARTSRSAQGVQGGADIITDCPLSLEVKDHATAKLAEWLDQAVAQARPGAPGVVLHKRRGKGDPGDWYATLRAADLIALVRHVQSKPN